MIYQPEAQDMRYYYSKVADSLPTLILRDLSVDGSLMLEVALMMAMAKSVMYSA